MLGEGANRACTSTGAVDPRLGSHAALVATIPVPNPPMGSVVHAPVVGSSRDAQEEGGGLRCAVSAFSPHVFGREDPRLFLPTWIGFSGAPLHPCTVRGTRTRCAISSHVLASVSVHPFPRVNPFVNFAPSLSSPPSIRG